MAIMDKETAETMPELAAAAETMAEVGNHLRADANKANAMLEKLQSQLFLNVDRQRTEKGTFIGGPVKYERHYELLRWSESGVNAGAYKNFMKGQASKA